MTPVSAPSRSVRRAAATAPGLGLALAALIGPPLSVFAAAGMAPLLALLALALIAGDGRTSLAAARSCPPIPALLVLISAWGAMSALWSPIPAHTLLESGRFLLISAAGLLALKHAAALDALESARLDRVLIAGVIAAILLLQIELHGDETVARYMLGVPEARLAAAGIGRYDRGVTVLMLLAWPAAAALATRRRWLGLALLAAAIGATVGEFSSRAAIIALAIGAAAAAVAAAAPRLAALGLVGAVVLAACVFPAAAPDGAGINRIRAAAPSLPDSAVHRLEIWRFVAERIADRPILGWGMDASRAVPGGKSRVIDLYPEVTMNDRAEALPLHPHDAALQWRLELGLPGTALVLAALAVALWRLARDHAGAPWRRALSFGYAAAALAVALLSFGAWQAWWLSTLWLGAALLARPDSDPRRRAGVACAP